MKKGLRLAAMAIMLMVLCSCSMIWPGKESTEKQTEASTEEMYSTTQTAQESTEPEETEAEETQAATLPAESLEISVDEVIGYFCEVVLRTEYSDGIGDATLVQKWTDRIHYRIYGEATEKDKQVLTTFFGQLNEIEGFPGIVPAGENDLTDLALYFYNQDEFNQSFGEFLNYEVADGAVQYWYLTETNEIYDGRIGYRTDIDQYTRNSVLLEEVFNGLGITDTDLREDSIAYQGFSQTQELSEVDWLMIRLLYHPRMKAGMNRDECVSVIREIYPLK